MGINEQIENLEIEIDSLRENPYLKDYQKIDEVMTKGIAVMNAIKRKLAKRKQLVDQKRQMEEQIKYQQPAEDDYADDTEEQPPQLSQEQLRVLNNPPRPVQRQVQQPRPQQPTQRSIQPQPQSPPARNFDYAPEEVGTDEDVVIEGLPDPEEI